MVEDLLGSALSLAKPDLQVNERTVENTDLIYI